MEKITRPLDLLNNSRGMEVLIFLKGGRIFSGKLVAFDLYTNLVIDKCRDVSDENKIKNLGVVFFRGESVEYVAPSKEK